MGRDAFKIWRGFIRDELVSLPWEEKGMSGSQGGEVPLGKPTPETMVVPSSSIPALSKKRIHPIHPSSGPN